MKVFSGYVLFLFCDGGGGSNGPESCICAIKRRKGWTELWVLMCVQLKPGWDYWVKTNWNTLHCTLIPLSLSRNRCKNQTNDGQKCPEIKLEKRTACSHTYSKIAIRSCRCELLMPFLSTHVLLHAFLPARLQPSSWAWWSLSLQAPHSKMNWTRWNVRGFLQLELN